MNSESKKMFARVCIMEILRHQTALDLLLYINKDILLDLFEEIQKIKGEINEI